MNSNAFEILSNYSFGYYNFVDLVDDAVDFLNRFSRNVMNGEPRDSAYWVRFLEYLQDEFSIGLIAEAITLEHDDFMQGVDAGTWYYDLPEQISNFQHGITHEQIAEYYRRIDHPTTWERVFDAWLKSYSNHYADFELEDEDTLIIAEKPHFAQVNHTLINEAIGKRAHKQLFKSQIAEELIAEAMHPHRMMARMQICDDIEQFFQAC